MNASSPVKIARVAPARGPDRVWLGAAAGALLVDGLTAPGFGAAHAVFALCAVGPAAVSRLVGARAPAAADGALQDVAWLTAAIALVAAGGWGFASWFVLPVAQAALRRGPRGGAEAFGLAALGLVGAAFWARLEAGAFDFGLLAPLSVLMIGARLGAETAALRARAPALEGEAARLASALADAEQERDAAVEAARARSRFFADMSHELRTPLNAVLGFSEAMQMKLFGPMSAKYAEYADLIHESAKHLLDLIGDVLDVNKIEEGRYELDVATFDARDAVQAAARLMRPSAEDKGVKLEAPLGDAPVMVDADARALKQMLLNLASNAVKFTPAGGTVSLAVRADGDDLAAEVRDTGPGLTAEEIKRVGRPFEQTERGKKHEGRSSGLGLALVRSLAELHGGALEIDSVAGEGAVFRVRLPVIARPKEAGLSMDARGRLQRIKAAGFDEPPVADASSEAPEG